MPYDPDIQSWVDFLTTSMNDWRQMRRRWLRLSACAAGLTAMYAALVFLVPVLPLRIMTAVGAVFSLFATIYAIKYWRSEGQIIRLEQTALDMVTNAPTLDGLSASIALLRDSNAFDETVVIK